MSGGYGRGGRGTEGYGGSGYGDEDYAQGYGEQGYGPDGREAGQQGSQPSWNDPYWQQQQGQPGGWQGQGPGQDAGYGPEYGQQGTWPDPRAQGQRQGGGPQQYDPRAGQQPGQRGTGPRPAQRGTGPSRQAPRGYDPRGAGSRRADDGYPSGGYQGRGDARSGQEGYGGRDSGGRDDSFVPGFGRRDEFEGRGPGRGRGGRYAGDSGQGQRDDRRGNPRGGGGGDIRGRDGWDDRDERRPRRGPVRRLAPWIALLVILTPLAIGAYYVYHLYENHVHPADYSGPGIAPSVMVQVKSGDTAFSLAPKLQALGVIASTRAFEDAAEASTNPSGLEVGYYKLNHHMQASLAWAALLNAKDRVQLTVTIPEGKRVSQVILLLAKATNMPAADFQRVVNNPVGLGLPSYANGKVEGYLFPATYTIEPNETALQVLQAMVARYNVEAQQVNLKSAATRVGLTSQEVIIEASMAQAEGGSVSDYAKIARVIINRQHDGMKLQFDSVLLYGLNAYAINVTQKQIDTPGPYNDFEHAGLPPGPICNPGNAAIEGILHPASGDWLYFLTVTGGKSKFSATPLTGQ